MNQGVRSMPLLAVRDVTEAANWFSGALGFSQAGSWKTDDGEDDFAICQLGLITIGLVRDPKAQPSGHWAAYFYVADIDAFTDDILARGTEIAEGPEDKFYGCREIEVKGPDGHLLCFGQDLKPGKDGPGL